MRKTDLTYLVEILSKHLNAASVHFSVEELQLCLLSCPTDITALSIVQTYTCLGGKASVFRADYDSTLKWGKSFLGQLSHDGKNLFVFVKEITGTDAIYYEGRLKRVVSASDFKKEWTGIVIAVENNKERNQEKKRLKTFIHSSLLLGIVVLVLINLHLSTLASVNCLLDVMGSILCFGVMMQSSSPYYNFFEHFCIANTRLDCQKLDLGRRGVIFRKANLGRMGFVYFISCTLATVLAVNSPNPSAIYCLLSLVSVGLLLLAIASISYQLFVKRFCLLCLGIMSILIVDGTLAFPIKGVPSYFSLEVGLFFFMVVLASSALLCICENYADAKLRAFSTRINELRIKRMQSVLRYFFMTKSTLLANEDSITLGNSKAPLTITTYLSPWCKTCKKVALEMIELLCKYPDYVNWKIYFDGVKSTSVNEVNLPQLYLYHYLARGEDTNRKLAVLKYWYKKKSIKGLLEKIEVSSKDIEAILERFNYQLDAMADEKQVPMVWINSRNFPSCYSLADLPYVLLDLCMIYSQEEKV